MNGSDAPLAPLAAVRSSTADPPNVVSPATAKLRRVLHLIGGGLLLVVAGALGVTQTHGHGSLSQWVILGAGFLLCLAGFVSLPQRFSVALQKVCISLVTFTVLLLTLEVFCRAISYDFVGEERAWRRIPLFFRWPTIPTGDVFFRRTGPESWTGRPIYERLAQLGIRPNPYRADPRITAKYDATGFRNEAGMKDWDIAVAGDSFTELGHLKYSELFTTILGQNLGLRVRNLGTSYTGPLTQLHYLRTYGLAQSTKCAVIVFYEGNDLSDFQSEAAFLSEFRRTGVRPARQFRKETSLLKTIYQLVFHTVRPARAGWPEDERRKSWISGYFDSADGEVPITLGAMPVASSQISAELRDDLQKFFADYAAFGKEHGLQVWSAYMPAKERVFHGMLRFSADASGEQKRWVPTDLPSMIAGIAQSEGVKFMDLTPALVARTRDGKELLYNGIWDTHLTAAGSAVVGREMARVISPGP